MKLCILSQENRQRKEEVYIQSKLELCFLKYAFFYQGDEDEIIEM